MRIKSLALGAGALLLLVAIAAPVILAPGPLAAPQPAAPVPATEHEAVLEALRPRSSDRPVIALVARNNGTEVADFLTIYGVLRRADVAEVVVVAERSDSIQLYPADLKVEPDITAADFDARYPDGADYVVVPAMDPGTDPFVAGWIATQYEKGAKIVSVCNGSRVLSTAGLLDGRRATGHWSAIAELRGRHPTMEYVPDRRYVADDGVATSTGITASVPTMLTLVEAIAGRDRAAEVADGLGVTDWSAEHRSANFALTLERMKTFVRNTVSFWRRERVGVPLADGVDEVALGLVLDAFSRTQLTTAVPLFEDGSSARSSHGLVLTSNGADGTKAVARTLPAPRAEAPVPDLSLHLAAIAEQYDRPTADIVALVMEYQWPGDGEVRE